MSRRARPSPNFKETPQCAGMAAGVELLTVASEGPKCWYLPSISSSLLSQETRTSSESIISVPASSTSGSPSRVIYVSQGLFMGTAVGGWREKGVPVAVDEPTPKRVFRELSSGA